MNAAEKLHEQYQRKLKLLQETCPHEKCSDWIEEWCDPWQMQCQSAGH